MFTMKSEVVKFVKDAASHFQNLHVNLDRFHALLITRL
jgi:hypothetical protein